MYLGCRMDIKKTKHPAAIFACISESTSTLLYAPPTQVALCLFCVYEHVGCGYMHACMYVCMCNMRMHVWKHLNAPVYYSNSSSTLPLLRL